MEYLAKKLTDYILSKGVIEEKDYDLYKYGLLCSLEIALSTATSIIIALFLKMLLPCLFFFLLFIPMRSFGGGLHLKSFFACYIGSCLILTSTLLAVKYFTLPLCASFMIFAFSAVIIIMTGPVDHPNREVDASENMKFKKRTNITVLFATGISILLILYKNNSYLMLEAITFAFLSITAITGKFAHRQGSHDQ
ncbi:MAG: accessory gene regulator B family protein [Butyrivibrio sp.]|nr:accessory gene regulator B family protein [Butyrivibrio sp.]